jgi:hypothetical protein
LKETKSFVTLNELVLGEILKQSSLSAERTTALQIENFPEVSKILQNAAVLVGKKLPITLMESLNIIMSTA